MFDDFDFDGNTIMLALVFWAITSAVIWKFSIGEGWGTPQKIFLTIASLPAYYIAIHWQVNR